MRKIARIEEIAVFENEYGVLFNDRVRGPTGLIGHYLRWRWSGSGVIVVPVFKGKFALRWMHRYSPDIISLEFPGGGVLEDETYEMAAARELGEEFGLLAHQVKVIGNIYPDTGILEKPIVVAEVEVIDPLISYPESTQEDFEAIDDEGENVIWMDKQQLFRAVTRGEICSGTTMAAALLYLAGHL